MTPMWVYYTLFSLICIISAFTFYAIIQGARQDEKNRKRKIR